MIRGTILIVDDDPGLRLSLEAIVSAEHDVVCAGGVVEACELIKSHAFDVVVTDFEMPDGTGQDVARFVEARQPFASVILLTGQVGYTAVRDIQRGGKLLVLFKPVEPEKLLGWVRNGVSMSRLNATTARLKEKTGALKRRIEEGGAP